MFENSNNLNQTFHLFQKQQIQEIKNFQGSISVQLF